MFTNKHYVFEVYKEKSFSQAAKNLYISQPSLSLTIKRIEEKIGSPLFDRSTLPIHLTDSGREYISCIEKIMDIEDSFTAYLSDLNDLRTGTLAIGASNFFASYILPPVMSRFKATYPLVAVKLIETNTTNLERQLYDGTLDLIIDNYEFNDTIYKRHFFYKEQMLLAVPAKLTVNNKLKRDQLTAEDIMAGKHLKAGFPPVDLTSFATAPFILLRPGNDTRDRADNIFAEQGLKPTVILELDQLATVYHIACHGMGIALISDTVVREMGAKDDMLFYKIGGAYAERENYFYYKHNKYKTRAMAEFLEIASM